MISQKPYKPGYRYGVWAGRPDGVKEDITCCVAEIFPAGRGAMHRQCDCKRGFGPQGRYCRRHDPAAIAAKEQASTDEYETQRRNQDRIQARAEQLIKRLGGGEEHYHSALRFKDSGYREALVLSFSEVEQLLLLLGREIP